MKYYPIFMNLAGRSCTVIGGGEVGERKALRLLACGAKVTVVSESATPDILILEKEGRLHHIEAAYEPGQIADAFLVIGATDRMAVNEAIFNDCRRLGILVNIVDDPIRCDFILPSLCERGDLSIAVSTSGKSPALAKKIRLELEHTYGPEYGILLQILGILRHQVLTAGGPSAQNRILFETLLCSPILEAIRHEEWERVQEIIQATTGLDVDLPLGGLS